MPQCSGKLIIDIFFDAGKWEEGKHPRGQPENAGEFANKAGGVHPAKASSKKIAGAQPASAKPATLSQKPLPITKRAKEPEDERLSAIANAPDKSAPDKIAALRATATYPGSRSETYKKYLIWTLRGNRGDPDEIAPGERPVAPGERPVIKPEKPPASWVGLASRAHSALKGENNPLVAKAMPSDDRSFWMGGAMEASRKAIIYYTGKNSIEVNSALHDLANASPEVLDQVKAIDKAFNSPSARLTNDIMVYRALTLPDDIYDKLVQSLKSGVPARFSHNGFVSTSLSQSFAGQFPGQTKLEIMVKKETPALSVRRISKRRLEDEVLLRHGQEFEVLEIEQMGSNRVIRCATV